MALPVLSPVRSWRWQRGIGEDRRNDRHTRPQFTANGLLGAIRNLTGIRSTTLVKLPVALSGGSRLNCAPLPGAMLPTIAVITIPGKVSTRISAPGQSRRE